MLFRAQKKARLWLAFAVICLLLLPNLVGALPAPPIFNAAHPLVSSGQLSSNIDHILDTISLLPKDEKDPHRHHWGRAMRAFMEQPMLAQDLLQYTAFPFPWDEHLDRVSNYLQNPARSFYHLGNNIFLSKLRYPAEHVDMMLSKRLRAKFKQEETPLDHIILIWHAPERFSVSLEGVRKEPQNIAIGFYGPLRKEDETHGVIGYGRRNIGSADGSSSSRSSSRPNVALVTPKTEELDATDGSPQRSAPVIDQKEVIRQLPKYVLEDASRRFGINERFLIPENYEISPAYMNSLNQHNQPRRPSLWHPSGYFRAQ